VFPVRDHNPSGSFPYVTIGLITLNTLVFLYEVSLGRRLETFLLHYGMVPYVVTYFSRIPGIDFSDVAITFFTSMFLHAGWLHIIGNMWYLWIFGDNIEDRLGHLRFIFFYLACGLAAALMQYLISPHSRVPMIGASGAIAGVLGAYLICFPRARIDLLIFFFLFVDIVAVPAFFVLAVWFVMQFFSGVFSLGAGVMTGGVAWWAHIAGFLTGIILIRILPRARRSRQTYHRIWFDG
jgi:membrane associated rhomboid family serine protease